MPSDPRNSTMAKAMGLIFFAIQCQEVHTCNAFFMDLPRPSFVSHSSFSPSIARDGFHLLQKLSIVATLITTVLFKQLLIRTAE